MIDNPDMLTPDTLRSEARNVRYTGRAHAAQVMEWAAERIAELERQVDDTATNYLKVVEGRDKRIAELEAHCDELQQGKNETYEAAQKRIAELEARVHLAFYEGFESKRLDVDTAWDESKAKQALEQK